MTGTIQPILRPFQKVVHQFLSSKDPSPALGIRPSLQFPVSSLPVWFQLPHIQTLQAEDYLERELPNPLLLWAIPVPPPDNFERRGPYLPFVALHPLLQLKPRSDCHPIQMGLFVHR